MQPSIHVESVIHDLAIEAVEQHAMACFVHQLRGEEDLLLLARQCIDHRHELGRQLVLRNQEEREDREKRPALLGREIFGPLEAVGVEIDGSRLPALTLPAVIELAVVASKRMRVVDQLVDVVGYKTCSRNDFVLSC